MEMNIIYHRAWSFHWTTGIDLDELISEATLAYIEAERKYDKDKKKAKFTTYVYAFITEALINYCKQIHKWQIINGHPNLNWVVQASNNLAKKTIDLSQFKPKTKELIEIVLENEDIYDFMNNPPMKNRRVIIDLLREKGWSWPQIWATFKDIKQILRNTPENELFS